MSDLLPRTADVVVIGGGVIGSSVAYHVARKALSVVLLEKGDFVSGSSGACDGLVFLQSKKPGPHLELALASRARFDELREELDSSIELRCEGGMITITTDAELHAMERFVEEQQHLGLEVSLVDGRRARELEPCLSHEVVASTFSPLDAQVNPIFLTLAFLRTAKRRGAGLFAHTSVTGIKRMGDGLHLVETPRGAVETRAVVNAAGVHAPEIGEMAGLSIPVIPRRGQLLVTEPLSPFLKRCLLSANYIAAKYNPELAGEKSLGVSIEQTANGNFLLGSTREFVGFDRRTTPEAVRRIVLETTRIIPRLKEAHVIRAFAGLRPYTPDGLPILGRVAGLKGFFMAAGHEGDGIALSPITGKLIAELIADGHSHIPLDSFALERFPSPEPPQPEKEAR